LDALKGTQTIVEIADRYQAHAEPDYPQSNDQHSRTSLHVAMCAYFNHPLGFEQFEQFPRSFFGNQRRQDSLASF